MFNYYLPDFYSNAALICFLADMIEHRPEWFYEDIRIGAAYGSFPSAIWNGGRVFINSTNKKQMQKYIEELNSRGIAVRYTFTNPLLEEKHLSDTFCNLCMELADNGLNEVIVNTQVLEDYIRKEYPRFKLISSTTKCLADEAAIRAELEKDYYLVVTDSALNNTDLLFSLDHKDKIELIVDHGCRDNCPNRREHYNIIGRAMLTFDEPQMKECPYVRREFAELKENASFITNEMIFGKYKDMGFKHFKLDGRSFAPHNLVESFLYYLVRPEYTNNMRAAIYKEIYKF